MNRPYNVAKYINIVNQIKSIRPEAHIATDIIVGFPTETKEDFQSTMYVINTICFASLHVFTYSPREKTKASSFGDSVSPSEKSNRSQTVINRGKELNYLYRSRFEGEMRDTVFEKHTDGIQKINSWEGITDNYIRVKFAGIDRSSAEDLNKRIVPVRITAVKPEYTLGEIAREKM